MSDRFQAFRANRVWVVIDNQNHQNVGDPFKTEQGATAECDRLNLKDWRESKPVSHLSEPLQFEDAGDLTDQIVEIVDKMYAPELMYLLRAA